MDQTTNRSGLPTKPFVTDEPILHSIIDGSFIPTFVIDREHRVLYWNRALEEISKIPASSDIGTNDHWRAFYRKQRPCMADLLVDGAMQEIPSWYAGKQRESTLIGEAFEATDFFPELAENGRWLRFTASTIRNDQGEIVGAVETLEDITDQKLAEEALKESQKRLYQILEGSPIAAFVIDRDHQVIFWNRALEGLQNQLPVAIQTLMSYWTQLQPAFQAIGVFLAESLIPFLGELSAWFTNSFVPALATVEEWLNKQAAAQEKLGASVRENVWPIFQQLWGWIQTNVIPIAQALWQQLKNWQTAFDGIKLRVLALLVQLRALIAQLPKIKLPNPFVGHSPSPFENTLTGIIGLMDTLAGQSLPRLTRAFSAMDQPMPTTGLSSLAARAAPRAPALAETPARIEGIDWQWLRMVSPADSVWDSPGREKYTLRLEAGCATGAADCNRFTGSFTLDGRNLNLVAMATTRAYCGPDSLGDLYVPVAWTGHQPLHQGGHAVHGAQVRLGDDGVREVDGAAEGRMGQPFKPSCFCPHFIAR